MKLIKFEKYLVREKRKSRPVLCRYVGIRKTTVLSYLVFCRECSVRKFNEWKLRFLKSDFYSSSKDVYRFTEGQLKNEVYEVSRY